MHRAGLMGGLIVAIVFGVATGLSGQAPPQAAGSAIDGRWEGTVGTPEGVVAAIVELKSEAGAIKGMMTAGPYVVTITGGSVQGEAVSLTIAVNNMSGTMAAVLKGDTVNGSWSVEGESGQFTLKRAAAPAAGAAAGAPSSSHPIVGEWDALTDAGGNQYPFSFTIALDGENVTGTISGAQGGGGPLKGTFKDNTLNFSTSMPDGAVVTLTAVLSEGTLTGTFDMGGQFQASWKATKRK